MFSEIGSHVFFVEFYSVQSRVALVSGGHACIVGEDSNDLTMGTMVRSVIRVALIGNIHSTRSPSENDAMVLLLLAGNQCTGLSEPLHILGKVNGFTTGNRP